jgi:hypothetical protein
MEYITICLQRDTLYYALLIGGLRREKTYWNFVKNVQFGSLQTKLGTKLVLLPHKIQKKTMIHSQSNLWRHKRT